MGIESAASVGTATFDLEEVSGLDIVDLGHTCPCRNDPDPNVVYPAFSSGKPLYGVMHVDMEFGTWRPGTAYPFALDESGGTGTGYDRLYIDLNRDGRLSDETPVTPLRELPEGALFTVKWVTPPIWFNPVTFSNTDEAGTHSVETIPHLLVQQGEFVGLSFTATKARKGEIEIAGRRYNATILNSSPLGTRWDRPGTVVKLETRAGVRMASWSGSDRLMAMHRIGDEYWRFSMTPAGDRFFVEPYQGPLGVVRIDLGGWLLPKATFSGALHARDKAVCVSWDDQNHHGRFVRSCEAPVGDYRPASLDVRCGPLTLSLSESGYANLLSGGRDPNSAYTLQVRKDKPCVLRLARKGEVLFASPDKQMRVRLGDPLQVTAMLVDSKSNMMVRNLRRVACERVSSAALTLIGLTIVGPLGAWIALGKNRGRYRYLPIFSGAGLLALIGYVGVVFALNAMLRPGRSDLAFEELRPEVIIARANGEIVKQDTMPFG